MIESFSASPDSFPGLELSCPDSDPYDNFTLTCTATKQTIVIPNLVIAWTHDGTIETGTVTTTGENMTATVTNTLSFDSVTASDSGTYRCTAIITIPESTDITTSEESTVTIRRKYDCFFFLSHLNPLFIYTCTLYIKFELIPIKFGFFTNF